MIGVEECYVVVLVLNNLKSISGQDDCMFDRAVIIDLFVRERRYNMTDQYCTACLWGHSLERGETVLSRKKEASPQLRISQIE